MAEPLRNEPVAAPAPDIIQAEQREREQGPIVHIPEEPEYRRSIPTSPEGYALYNKIREHIFSKEIQQKLKVESHDMAKNQAHAIEFQEYTSKFAREDIKVFKEACRFGLIPNEKSGEHVSIVPIWNKGGPQGKGYYYGETKLDECDKKNVSENVFKNCYGEKTNYPLAYYLLNEIRRNTTKKTLDRQIIIYFLKWGENILRYVFNRDDDNIGRPIKIYNNDDFEQLIIFLRKMLLCGNPIWEAPKNRHYHTIRPLFLNEYLNTFCDQFNLERQKVVITNKILDIDDKDTRATYLTESPSKEITLHDYQRKLFMMFSLYSYESGDINSGFLNSYEKIQSILHCPAHKRNQKRIDEYLQGLTTLLSGDKAQENEGYIKDIFFKYFNNGPVALFFLRVSDDTIDHITPRILKKVLCFKEDGDFFKYDRRILNDEFNGDGNMNYEDYISLEIGPIDDIWLHNKEIDDMLKKNELSAISASEDIFNYNDINHLIAYDHSFILFYIYRKFRIEHLPRLDVIKFLMNNTKKNNRKLQAIFLFFLVNKEMIQQNQQNGTLREILEYFCDILKKSKMDRKINIFRELEIQLPVLKEYITTYNYSLILYKDYMDFDILGRDGDSQQYKEIKSFLESVLDTHITRDDLKDIVTNERYDDETDTIRLTNGLIVDPPADSDILELINSSPKPQQRGGHTFSMKKNGEEIADFNLLLNFYSFTYKPDSFSIKDEGGDGMMDVGGPYKILFSKLGDAIKTIYLADYKDPNYNGSHHIDSIFNKSHVERKNKISIDKSSYKEALHLLNISRIKDPSQIDQCIGIVYDTIVKGPHANYNITMDIMRAKTNLDFKSKYFETKFNEIEPNGVLSDETAKQIEAILQKFNDDNPITLTQYSQGSIEIDELLEKITQETEDMRQVVQGEGDILGRFKSMAKKSRYHDTLENFPNAIKVPLMGHYVRQVKNIIENEIQLKEPEFYELPKLIDIQKAIIKVVVYRLVSLSKTDIFIQPRPEFEPDDPIIPGRGAKNNAHLLPERKKDIQEEIDIPQRSISNTKLIQKNKMPKPMRFSSSHKKCESEFITNNRCIFSPSLYLLNGTGISSYSTIYQFINHHNYKNKAEKLIRTSYKTLLPRVLSKIIIDYAYHFKAQQLKLSLGAFRLSYLIYFCLADGMTNLLELENFDSPCGLCKLLFTRLDDDKWNRMDQKDLLKLMYFMLMCLVMDYGENGQSYDISDWVYKKDDETRTNTLKETAEGLYNKFFGVEKDDFGNNNQRKNLLFLRDLIIAIREYCKIRMLGLVGHPLLEIEALADVGLWQYILDNPLEYNLDEFINSVQVKYGDQYRSVENDFSRLYKEAFKLAISSYEDTDEKKERSEKILNYLRYVTGSGSLVRTTIYVKYYPLSNDPRKQNEYDMDSYRPNAHTCFDNVNVYAPEFKINPQTGQIIPGEKNSAADLVDGIKSTFFIVTTSQTFAGGGKTINKPRKSRHRSNRKHVNSKRKVNKRNKKGSKHNKVHKHSKRHNNALLN